MKKYLLEKTKEAEEFLKKVLKGPIGEEYCGFTYNGGTVMRGGRGVIGHLLFGETPTTVIDTGTDGLLRIISTMENNSNVENKLLDMFKRVKVNTRL